MENNYNNNELNKRVLKELERKITINKFIEKNGVKMKNRKERYFIGIKVASIVLVLGIIIGNAYTYATYDENIFSFILNKIGIFEEYKKDSKDVNITQINNDISLTLTDYGIDSNNLIVGYNLKLKEEKEFNKEIFDETKISNGTEIFSLENNGVQLFSKITNTEYIIYKFYKIDISKLSDNNTFMSNVNIYEYIEEGEETLLGNWSFNINLEKSKLNLIYEEYAVENKKVTYKQVDMSNKREKLPKIQLLEVKKSDMTTKLTFLLDDYTTEPSITHIIEILDENNNVILERDLEHIMGGVVSDIILKNVEFNSKLKIKFYELDIESKKIFSEGEMELDLSKDLIKKNKNNVSKIKKKWQGLEFEYNKGAQTYEDNYLGKEKDETTHYIDIHLYKTIGNEQIDNGLISISCYKNIYNRDLNKVVDELKRLEFLGGYKYSHKYTLYLKKLATGEDDVGEIELTHKQMMDLSDEKNLVVNGINISKDDIDVHEVEYQDMKNIKIDKQNAITFVQTYGGPQRMYVFLNNDYIYQISCPTDFDSQDDVQDFINSIKIK